MGVPHLCPGLSVVEEGDWLPAPIRYEDIREAIGHPLRPTPTDRLRGRYKRMNEQSPTRVDMELYPVCLPLSFQSIVHVVDDSAVNDERLHVVVEPNARPRAASVNEVAHAERSLDESLHPLADGVGVRFHV